MARYLAALDRGASIEEASVAAEPPGDELTAVSAVDVRPPAEDDEGEEERG